MISYAHDFDLYRAWAELLIFERFEAPRRQFACGAAYLRGLGEGRVQAIEGLEAVQRELGSVLVESKLPRIGQAASGTYEGEGFLIVRHPQTHVVEAALQRIVSSVRVVLG